MRRRHHPRTSAGSGPIQDPNTDPLLERLCQALTPQYEYAGLVGRGAMGTVYLFHEIAADRPVAVKVLPGDLAADEHGKERFRREAQVAANLRHPNIVPIFVFGETQDLLYYVMQYVEGESLGARINREGPLPADEVRRIMVAVSDALAQAHEQGVVHRDIKPENILLERMTGRPMLTDFGIARLAGSPQVTTGGTRSANQRHLRLTGTGVAIGSPVYMAPEQATGSAHVDLRADIYALGATAYEALTGEIPVVAETIDDLLTRKAAGKHVRVRSRRRDVPRELAAVIEKCLAPSPRNRWPSAEKLRELLEGQSYEYEGDGAARRVSEVGFWLLVVIVHLVVVGGALAIAVNYFDLPISMKVARTFFFAALPITLLIAWPFWRRRKP